MFNALKSIMPHDEYLRVAEDLTKRYLESHRFHHGLKHIFDSMMLSKTLGNSLIYSLIKNHSERTLLELVILFHDSVYELFVHTNEVNSAALFKTYCEPYLSKEDLERGQKAILASDHREVNPFNDMLINCFLDIDLAVLGTRKEVFDNYDNNIRKEYASVPEDIYESRRIKILKGFLNRDRIYKTEWFHMKYEYFARENLKRRCGIQ